MKYSDETDIHAVAIAFDYLVKSEIRKHKVRHYVSIVFGSMLSSLVFLMILISFFGD